MIDQEQIDDNARRLKRSGELGITCKALDVIEALTAENAQLRAGMNDINEQFRQLAIDFMRMEQRLQALEFPERTRKAAKRAADDFMAGDK